MFIVLLLVSTLLAETSETLGKTAVKRKHQTVFDLAFLSLFWTEAFLIISVIAGARFVVVPASIPNLVLRVVLETTLSYIIAVSVVRADRSTLGFMRIFAIPLLLASDIALGYHLSLLQISGVAVMFFGLVVAFRHQTSRHGLGFAMLIPILIAATTAVYKWDISHLNSVAGEQIIVYFFVLIFFYLQSSWRSQSPLKLLVRRRSGLQSIASGFGLAIDSFAVGLAPASVVISTKRILALMWSVIVGRKFFHEGHLRNKLVAGAFVMTGLVLLVSPYL